MTGSRETASIFKLSSTSVDNPLEDPAQNTATTGRFIA